MPISQRRAVIPAGAPYNADRWVMIAAIATSDCSDPYYKLPGNSRANDRSDRDHPTMTARRLALCTIISLVAAAGGRALPVDVAAAGRRAPSVDALDTAYVSNEDDDDDSDDDDSDDFSGDGHGMGHGEAEPEYFTPTKALHWPPRVEGYDSFKAKLDAYIFMEPEFGDWLEQKIPDYYVCFYRNEREGDPEVYLSDDPPTTIEPPHTVRGPANLREDSGKPWADFDLETFLVMYAREKYYKQHAINVKRSMVEYHLKKYDATEVQKQAEAAKKKYENEVRSLRPGARVPDFPEPPDAVAWALHLAAIREALIEKRFAERDSYTGAGARWHERKNPGCPPGAYRLN